MNRIERAVFDTLILIGVVVLLSLCFQAYSHERENVHVKGNKQQLTFEARWWEWE
jgi:hypothetical protein